MLRGSQISYYVHIAIHVYYNSLYRLVVVLNHLMTNPRYGDSMYMERQHQPNNVHYEKYISFSKYVAIRPSI